MLKEFEEEDVIYLNAGESHSALLNSKNELFMWGSNEFG